MGQAVRLAKLLSMTLERVVGWLVILFSSLMVIVVLSGIVSRTVFNHQFFWTEELGRYTMIYCCLLSIGIALNRGLHVGIGFFLQYVPIKVCIAFDLLARVLIFAFLSTMIYYSILLLDIISMQISPTLYINMVWVFIITPITCGLQLIFLLLRTIVDYSTGLEGKHIALHSQGADF